jgi:hypothetical protein
VTGYAVFMFVLAVPCVVMAVKPRATWRITEAWQFKDPEAAELRDDISVMRSTAAGLVALMLVGFGIWLLVTGDERECERILAELEDAAAGVDFDGSGLEEIGDDFDARWDLRAVANGLDVELEDRGRSIEVVDENGDVLGTIDEDGVHDRCGG